MSFATAVHESTRKYKQWLLYFDDHDLISKAQAKTNDAGSQCRCATKRHIVESPNQASLSSLLKILPEADFGTVSTNLTPPLSRKCGETLSATNSAISASSTDDSKPGFKTTKALGSSPTVSSLTTRNSTTRKK